jgi:hypothetical protein
MGRILLFLAFLRRFHDTAKDITYYSSFFLVHVRRKIASNPCPSTRMISCLWTITGGRGLLKAVLFAFDDPMTCDAASAAGRNGILCWRGDTRT